MIGKKLLALAATLLALNAAAAAPEQAAQILDKAKQASGGSAWDTLATVHTTSKVAIGGLSGTLESWEDLRTGRFCSRYALGPVTGADGFDGQVVWTQDASRQSKTEDDVDAREGAASAAYRRCLAYWFPSRWEGSGTYQGARQEGSRRFHLVRFTPKGGRVFDLWVDAGTYLFDRIVEKTALDTQTTFFSDYRPTSGVMVPFASRLTNGEPQYDQVFSVDQIAFDVSIPDEKYKMPPPPPPDFTIAGGQTAAVVPFSLINNHIYLKARLNGQGPFQLMCDTGGANVVTPELAARLGLSPEGKVQGRGVGEKSQDTGFVKMQTLAVGEVTLSDQVFLVISLETLAGVGGAPLDGAIGYEVFKRFVVKIDYEHSELTLTVPAAFSYRGTGTVVPFTFNDSTPEVTGDIDGTPGTFAIDTGSRSSVTILAPFAKEHDLASRYGATTEMVTGWGVGGASRGLLTRAKVLRLGEVSIAEPLMVISTARQGVFADPHGAGNVGGGVLKRFNITFDYANKVLIFERNANDARPDDYDRSGMWLLLAGNTFQVVDVTAGGPAAQAGVREGDVILTIDGRTPAEMPLPAVRTKFRTDPVGTAYRLQVESRAARRELILTLRDFVFEDHP
jgi:hypothetical protein